MSVAAISKTNINPKSRIAFKNTTQAVPYQTAPIVAPQAAPVVIPSVPEPSVGSKPKDMSKTVVFASSALAIASAGVAIYAMAKSRKAGALKGQVESLTRELTENKQTTEALKEAKAAAERRLNGIDAGLNDVRNGVNEAKSAAGNTTVITQPGFQTRGVDVFWERYNLASVKDVYNDAGQKIDSYGVYGPEMRARMRAESTRRVLGAVKPIELPDKPNILLPTAECKPFSSTGGMAIVPPEAMANIGAVMNKDGATIMPVMPLYLKEAEGKPGCTKFMELVRIGEDRYEYIQRQNGKETKLATLTKIDEKVIDLYTDKGIEPSKFELFLGDEMTWAVSYEETLAQLDKSTQEMITKKLNAGEDVETSLIRFIAPKPNSAKVQLPNKESFDWNISTILSSLEPEKAKEIEEKLANGCVYELPVTDFWKNRKDSENVFDGEARAKLFEYLEIGEDGAIHAKEGEAPVIRFMPEVSAKAEMKYQPLFVKNKRLEMAGPVREDRVKNIYSDTQAADETEKFVCFCRGLYEFLASPKDTSKHPIRADWIIGNDWHTGPLSAMCRMSTLARKAFGDIDKAEADRLQNIPITTLMHNFKLRGQTWKDKEKILNMMFGEHAAEIVENAHMPHSMPPELWNGMFSRKDINPQTMAMAYSDDIVFVSKGNATEATTIGEKGGVNYELASLRARTHDFSQRDKLEEIAAVHGIKPEEIPDYPTAKGITNGCDSVNNRITKQKARTMEKNLNLREGSLISAERAIENPFLAHQNNKKVYLEKVKEEVELARSTKGAQNPMRIYNPENTDLSGVDENTMIIGAAGRIVDQKGLDIHMKGYKEFISRGNYDKSNPPVIYIQGNGEKGIIEMMLREKEEIAKIDPLAAKRIVICDLFSEPGRYDGSKILSDFSAMSSWDEPCGLVHKEIGYASGAVPIVNKVGGLRDGYTEYVRGAGEANKGSNAIFSEFMDKDTHSYEEAIAHNASAWADALETASELYKDKSAFENAINNSYRARFDWLKKDGPIQEYIEIGQRHGVINPAIKVAAKDAA